MLFLIAVLGCAAIVGILAIKPMADVRLVADRSRFRIVDFLALMVYVQVALVFGVGFSRSDLALAALWMTLLAAALWAIVAVTASQLGLVSSWRRLIWELVLAPATILLMCFTGLMAPILVLESQSIPLLVGAITIVTAGTYGLRQLTRWVVKDLPRRQPGPATSSPEPFGDEVP